MDKKLLTYKPGMSFGELALLYSCPRQASIKTETACILWKLDRTTFKRILMQAAIARRTDLESIFKSIPFLNNLE